MKEKYRHVKHKCNAIFLISYIIYNVFHFWYYFISLYLCQIFYCISLDATQCITFETKQITSLQSRKCMLHLHSVFNSFTCLGMCIFPSSILLKECDIWYSALVHKSSVRAFLLITFNLLKKTISSSKLFFVYSLDFRLDYTTFKILKYISYLRYILIQNFTSLLSW